MFNKKNKISEYSKPSQKLKRLGYVTVVTFN